MRKNICGKIRRFKYSFSTSKNLTYNLFVFADSYAGAIKELVRLREGSTGIAVLANVDNLGPIEVAEIYFVYNHTFYESRKYFKIYKINGEFFIEENKNEKSKY